MDSVNSLITFVQVADSGSIAAAGKTLGISASAVGKSIARLEDRVNAKLFHRTTRSLKLTEEGIKFLSRCRRIISEIELAENELQESITLPKGKLKISLPMLGEPFISELSKFQKKFPEIELDALFSDRKVNLISEEFDIVLRTGRVEDSQLMSKKIGDFRMMLVASPEYIREFGIPLNISCLDKHRCIVFRFPDNGRYQKWILNEDGIIHYFVPKIFTLCSSLEARLGYALNGLGITYLPDFTVKAYLKEGKLVSILDKKSTSTNELNMIWSSGQKTPLRVRNFIDHFSKDFIF